MTRPPTCPAQGADGDSSVENQGSLSAQEKDTKKM
jgi:hypothetical protein